MPVSSLSNETRQYFEERVPSEQCYVWYNPMLTATDAVSQHNMPFGITAAGGPRSNLLINVATGDLESGRRMVSTPPRYTILQASVASFCCVGQIVNMDCEACCSDPVAKLFMKLVVLMFVCVTLLGLTTLKIVEDFAFVLRGIIVLCVVFVAVGATGCRCARQTTDDAR